LHIAHRVAFVAEIAHHDIEIDIGLAMTDMGIGIDGRAADIDSDFFVAKRLKNLLFSGEGVVDF